MHVLKRLHNLPNIGGRYLSSHCHASLKRVQPVGAKHDIPFNIKMTNVGSHICTTMSSHLESITVNQLKLMLMPPNTIHFGKILHGKITSDPEYINELNVTILTVDDQQGNDIVIQVHNTNQDMYKKHGLISVKEPIITYCNNFEYDNKPLLCIQTDNWYYNIMYDDYSQETDTGLKEENSLKNITHNIWKYAQNGKYKEMFEHIDRTKAQLTDDRDKFQFQLFLPMIYLQSKQYMLGINAALEFLDQYVHKNDIANNPKIQFLIIDLVMMYAKIRRYDECINILTKYFTPEELKNSNEGSEFKSIQPKGFNVSTLYKSFLKLSKQKYDGLYKLEDLQHILHYTNERDINHGLESFYGNIAIKYINEERGRGIIATKDIKKDEIICVEQAGFYEVHDSIAIRYGNMNDMKTLSRMHKTHTFTKTLLNYIYHQHCEYDDASILMRYRLSQMCGYKLDEHEDDYDVKNMNVPDIDLFKYEQLPHDVSKEEVIQNVHISSEDIRNIVLQNAFSIYIPRDMQKLQHLSMPYTALKLPVLSQEAMDLCDDGTGLFFIPSFFNHQNDEKRNAYRIIYGHIMFIVALKDIQCGEEIFHPYYPSDANQDIVKSFRDRFV